MCVVWAGCVGVQVWCDQALMMRWAQQRLLPVVYAHAILKITQLDCCIKMRQSGQAVLLANVFPLAPPAQRMA